MSNTNKTNFSSRHIGPSEAQTQDMLTHINAATLETLIDQTIPSSIRLNKDLTLPKKASESDLTKELKTLGEKNQSTTSYIGMGFYNTIMPPVIQRNIFENPGWYTQYTPYQSEISQGRLEALFNFQTLIVELTKMDIANASLLDESSATAEAMQLLHRVRPKEKNSAHTCLVCQNIFPQTLDVLNTRANPLNINLKKINSLDSIEQLKDTLSDTNNDIFALILQYPNQYGNATDLSHIINIAHHNNIKVCLITDLMALTLLKPPGEFGADIVVGNTQRFGVPLGYGGPHAAFIATRNEFQRQLPGRIIGLSIDKHKNPAYRMALQTREQHIRKEKATSNICTAQALLAILASMYAIYHGPKGLKNIGLQIHTLTAQLNTAISELNITQKNKSFFDTLHIQTSPDILTKIKNTATKKGINFRYINSTEFSISIDETTTQEDISNIIEILSSTLNKPQNAITLSESTAISIETHLQRNDKYLSQPNFNNYHSETKMLRYIKELEKKDLSLTQAMIPLGSCTMKLTGTTLMTPLSWPQFSDIHPFSPTDQTQGYQQIISELETFLSEITGFHATSLQPNSGAQGEYAGLLTIRNYFMDNKQANRKTILIPVSAHGTNPATASMAGLDIIPIKCDENGNVNVEDLKKKAEKYSTTLAGLMITYPSTHGVFEEAIQEICDTIHKHGGLVYMDGANMNAQVGLTNPATIGADVCHLNLHKTFSIPHGGGGPGMGPICVTEQLAPYLPNHSVIKLGNNKGGAVSATPWGSASILIISYAYIRLLGQLGLPKTTQYAILNANYIKSRLESQYKVLFQGKNKRVAHELIIDFREFKKTAKIEVEDIAKRLIDYGFHAPTMSWPVPGTLMIEPTESEDKEELDRFCDALLSIKQEIKEIQDGTADPVDNVLKNAPHTVEEVSSDDWTHPYSRKKAAYPIDYLTKNKFWPAVGRVDNAYGDRNIMCSCASVEDFSTNSV